MSEALWVSAFLRLHACEIKMEAYKQELVWFWRICFHADVEMLRCCQVFVCVECLGNDQGRDSGSALWIRAATCSPAPFGRVGLGASAAGAAGLVATASSEPGPLRVSGLRAATGASWIAVRVAPWILPVPINEGKRRPLRQGWIQRYAHPAGRISLSEREVQTKEKGKRQDQAGRIYLDPWCNIISKYLLVLIFRSQHSAWIPHYCNVDQPVRQKPWVVASDEDQLKLSAFHHLFVA